MHKKGLVHDDKGQDLIEYALMAGFVSVAAGAIMPGVATMIGGVLAKASSMAGAPASTTLPEGVAIVRIVCAVLAALFLALIILRRKQDMEE